MQRQVTVSSAVAFKVRSSKMYFMYIFSATMCYFSSEYSHTFGDIDSRKKQWLVTCIDNYQNDFFKYSTILKSIQAADKEPLSNLHASFPWISGSDLCSLCIPSKTRSVVLDWSIRIVNRRNSSITHKTRNDMLTKIDNNWFLRSGKE